MATIEPGGLPPVTPSDDDSSPEKLSEDQIKTFVASMGAFVSLLGKGKRSEEPKKQTIFQKILSCVKKTPPPYQKMGISFSKGFNCVTTHIFTEETKKQANEKSRDLLTKTQKTFKKNIPEILGNLIETGSPHFKTFFSTLDMPVEDPDEIIEQMKVQSEKLIKEYNDDDSPEKILPDLGLLLKQDKSEVPVPLREIYEKAKQIREVTGLVLSTASTGKADSYDRGSLIPDKPENMNFQNSTFSLLAVLNPTLALKSIQAPKQEEDTNALLRDLTSRTNTLEQEKNTVNVTGSFTQAKASIVKICSTILNSGKKIGILEIDTKIGELTPPLDSANRHNLALLHLEKARLLRANLQQEDLPDTVKVSIQTAIHTNAEIASNYLSANVEQRDTIISKKEVELATRRLKLETTDSKGWAIALKEVLTISKEIINSQIETKKDHQRQIDLRNLQLATLNDELKFLHNKLDSLKDPAGADADTARSIHAKISSVRDSRESKTVEITSLRSQITKLDENINASIKSTLDIRNNYAGFHNRKPSLNDALFGEIENVALLMRSNLKKDNQITFNARKLAKQQADLETFKQKLALLSTPETSEYKSVQEQIQTVEKDIEQTESIISDLKTPGTIRSAIDTLQIKNLLGHLTKEDYDNEVKYLKKLQFSSTTLDNRKLDIKLRMTKIEEEIKVFDKSTPAGKKAAKELQDLEAELHINLSLLKMLLPKSTDLLLKKLQDEKTITASRQKMNSVALRVERGFFLSHLGIKSIIPDSGATAGTTILFDKIKGNRKEGIGVVKPSRKEAVGFTKFIRNFFGTRQRELVPLTEKREIAMPLAEVAFTTIAHGLQLSKYGIRAEDAETLFPTTVMVDIDGSEGEYGSCQAFVEGFSEVGETPFSMKYYTKYIDRKVKEKKEELLLQIAAKQIPNLDSPKITEDTALNIAQLRSDINKGRKFYEKILKISPITDDAIKAQVMKEQRPKGAEGKTDPLTLFQVGHLMDVYVGDVDRHEANWMVKMMDKDGKVITPPKINKQAPRAERKQQEANRKKFMESFDWEKFYADGGEIKFAMIDNANIFQKKSPKKNIFTRMQGLINARKMFAWKKHPLSQYPLTAAAKSFVKKQLTSQMMRNHVDKIRHSGQFKGHIDPQVIDKFLQEAQANDQWLKRIAVLQELTKNTNANLETVARYGGDLESSSTTQLIDTELALYKAGTGERREEETTSVPLSEKMALSLVKARGNLQKRWSDSAFWKFSLIKKPF